VWGPTCSASLFSISHQYQTREVLDFSSTSLSPFSPVPKERNREERSVFNF